MVQEGHGTPFHEAVTCLATVAAYGTGQSGEKAQ